MNKSATLKDLATKLNTSVTTISKALSNHPDISEKRKREILKLAEEMNYVPNVMAKSLRNQKTKFIGVIVGDNSNPYLAMMIKGVEERLTTEGYHTLIFNTNEDPKKEIDLIMELRSIHVAGVIINPAAGNRESTELLKKFGIPYVLANRYLNKNSDNYVIADFEKASYLATDYLAKYNYEKMFLLNFIDGVSASVDRCVGYEKALNMRGIIPQAEWIIHGCANPTDGYNAVRGLLNNHKLPFSVLCFNDFVALGAMQALNEKSIKIPNEVAIMGIDNIEMLSFMRPGLSTVNIPKSELGRKSADLLMEIINCKETADEKQIVLEPSLVIRETA